MKKAIESVNNNSMSQSQACAFGVSKSSLNARLHRKNGRDTLQSSTWNVIDDNNIIYDSHRICNDLTANNRCSKKLSLMFKRLKICFILENVQAIRESPKLGYASVLHIKKQYLVK